MKISNISIERPIAVTMFLLISVVLGLLMMSLIPIELFPDTDMPIITVTTKYYGASPEEIEKQVTQVLEEEFATLDNLDSISSISMQDASTIMIEFDWGTDLDIAAVNVQAKVDKLKKDLPPDLTEEPLVEKINPNDRPTLQYSLTAPDNYSLGDLYLLADNQIKPQLEGVNDVASVKIFGGRENEVKVLLDSDKMKTYGLTVPAVVDGMDKETRNYTIGKIDQGNKELTIKIDGEVDAVKELENITFNTPTGGRVYLKDFATVEVGYQDTDETIYFNGERALGVYIYKQADGNTVELSENVKKQIEEIEKQLPSDVKLDLIIDDAEYINDSIDNLIHTALVGALIAVVVLFLFLGRISSTAVVSLAIPIVSISTFSLMYFSGITINLITLAAISISIGLMVDDAIVVMQNINRHYHEEGLGIIEAAKVGTMEVGTAIFASTITKVIVFLPLLFVDGLVAQIFNPLAMTVTFALIISLIVSLTVTPMLSAVILKYSFKDDGKKRKFNWFFSFLDRIANYVNKYIKRLENWYKGALVWALGHRKTVISIAIASLLLGLAFVPFIGGEFMPGMDTGNFSIEIEMPKGTQVEYTDEVVREIMQDLDEIPEMDMYVVTMGRDKNSSIDIDKPDYAAIDAKLVGLAERDRSTGEIVDELRKSIDRFPGADITVKEEGLVSSNPFSSDPVYLTIKGNDQDELKRISEEVLTIVESVPGTREASSSFSQGQPEAKLSFDREKLKDYGLDIYSISKTVRIALNGQVIGTYSSTNGEELDVRVQYEGESLENLNDLNHIYVFSPITGTQVPLGQFVTIDETQSPSAIYHDNKIKMAFVSSDIYGRDLQSVNEDIVKELDKIDLPPGYTIEFGGESEDMEESFADLGKALILAVILIYMVMAATFESFKHPLVILFTLPLTFFGVSASLALTGRSLSTSSILGVIMLVGIVVGNSIVLVEYTNMLRHKHGMSIHDALLKAGPTRLHPILMTTSAIVLELIPLAIGLGEGSEMHAPMATVVVGGLSLATLLTLFVIPVLYSLFENKEYQMGLEKKKIRES